MVCCALHHNRKLLSFALGGVSRGRSLIDQLLSLINRLFDPRYRFAVVSRAGFDDPCIQFEIGRKSLRLQTDFCVVCKQHATHNSVLNLASWQ